MSKNIFCKKDGLRSGPGVIQHMRRILVSQFPDIDDKILYFMARLFTFVRLRTINRKIKLKNAKTLRSKKKTAQLSQV